jgi:hypothetical protein
LLGKHSDIKQLEDHPMKTISLLFCVCLSLSVYAKSDYAVVGGAVTDPQRKPVAGATVKVTSLGTQAVRKAGSDA